MIICEGKMKKETKQKTTKIKINWKKERKKYNNKKNWSLKCYSIRKNWKNTFLFLSKQITLFYKLKIFCWIIEKLCTFYSLIYTQCQAHRIWLANNYWLNEWLTITQTVTNLTLCILPLALQWLITWFQQYSLPSLWYHLRRSLVWQLFAQALETDKPIFKQQKLTSTTYEVNN